MIQIARAALGARLPDGFQWGAEALEQFDFGKERAALAVDESVRALGSLHHNAPSLADPEAFRAALAVLGLNQNTAAGVLGLLPRQVRRYCSRNAADHRKPPRSLEILIALFIALR